MAKKPLNEGIVERFLTAVFTAVAKKKEARLLAQLDKDPTMQKMTKQLIDSRDRLEKYLQQQRQDPKFKKWEDEFNKMSGLK